MSNIFITGATGFLGSNLLKVFMTEEENHAYIMIRSRDNRSALERRDVLINKTFPKSMQRQVSSRIHAVRGDISKENLGLDKKDFRNLQDVINTIYHCAAIREFGYNLTAIRKINVKGTENLLKVALSWKKSGALEYLHHIGTVYVTGNYKGRFYEKQTDVSQKFNNTYEQSKFEAELVCLKYRERGLPIDIYRPSIITDTIPLNGGFVSLPLKFLLLFTLEIFEKIPAEKNTRLNMVPVDTVSRAINLISTTKKRPLNQNYHIVNPRSVKLDLLLDTASRFFKFRKPRFTPSAKFRMEDLTAVQQKLLEAFIPYLNQSPSFDMRNASSVFKRYNFKIPHITKEALIKMFKCYRLSGLIPKKGVSNAIKR